MANGHDQFYDQSSGMGFVTGLFTGAVIGAGLGLLFAPRPGSDLRRELAESAGDAGKALSDQYSKTSQAVGQTIDDLAARGRHAYDQARDVASDARAKIGRKADEAMKGAENVASAARELKQTATDAYKEAAADSGSRF